MSLREKHSFRPRPPLRVGWIVTPLSPFGGTVTHIARWAEGLDPARFEPTLFYFSPEEAVGIPLPLPARLPRVRLPGLDLRRRDPRAAVGETLSALRAHRIDLVHTVFIGADIIGLLAATATRLPVMSSVEGDLLVSHLRPPWRTVLATVYRLLSPKFSTVTAISQTTARNLEPYLRMRTPIDVLYPGVPPAPLRPLPPLAAGPCLVAVGRLAPVKGLPLLIEATQRLLKRHPGLHVLLVGDGPEREPLEALIRSRGLEQAVRITGWVSREEVGRYLELAHLLVLPSYSEGLPWVTLEAMARGVPVVAARVGGLPELIVEAPESARTGYLVEPNRSDRLTMALAGALEGPDAAERLEAVGRRARERIMTHFSAKTEISMLEDIYMRVAGRRGRRPL